MANNKKTVQVTIDPRSQVSGPSVGLLVTGIVGAVLEVTTFMALVIGTSFCTFIEHDFSDKYVGFFQGSFGIASSFVGIIVAGFIIFAALKMKELNQWGLCIAASILAMIPCVSPCCIIGLPIGIWSLVVLTKDDVRAAFH